MKDNQTLKLRILCSSLGIVMLAVVLYYFIKTDLSRDYPLYLSSGSICLLAIICSLVYGNVYCDIKLLNNEAAHAIFRGFDIIKTVSVGLIFLIGTILSSFFLQHIIIPLIGFSLVSFSVKDGLRFIVFDYSARTVNGLIRDRKMTFDNLEIIEADNQKIKVKILDPEDTVVFNRETCTQFNWTRILNNFNQVNGCPTTNKV